MGGRWVELEHAWHDTTVVPCEVCGKLIPRRAWIFDGAGGEVRSCGPECQQLYWDYWYPTHGEVQVHAHR
jgi:hypothetical protein